MIWRLFWRRANSALVESRLLSCFVVTTPSIGNNFRPRSFFNYTTSIGCPIAVLNLSCLPVRHIRARRRAWASVANMAGIYTISSSPPPRHFQTFDMSSSPPLPSVKDDAKRKAPTLRAGSRASPIPQYATATFTTASTLLRRSSTNLDLFGAIEASGDVPNEGTTKPAKAKPRKVAAKKTDAGEGQVAKPPRKTATKELSADGEVVKKPRKPRAKKIIELGKDGGPVKAPTVRKPRAKKADLVIEGDDTPKEKPARKPRAKKGDTESQPKIKKGKVTKASMNTKSGNVELGVKSAGPDVFAESMDYGLVEAVRRRTTWTPPPGGASVTITTPMTTTGDDRGATSIGSLASEEKSRGFTDLLESYGFAKPEISVTSQKMLAGEVTRKRKLIELVKTSVPTSAAPKVKAPKKKPRTLTDLATSAYREEEEAVEELATTPAPLLQYFVLQQSDNMTSDGFKIPPKPRAKSPVKKAAKGKKGTAQAPILLSPESAMKQVGKQDFVFGTSSQLAREDSPGLLRDLHDAMQASNEADSNDHFALPIIEAPATSDRQQLATTKRNLWAAASRDAAGDLLEVEMIDLADSSPAIPTKVVQADPPAPSSSILGEEDEDFWHDVEELSQSLTQTQPTQPSSIGPVEAAIRFELQNSPSKSAVPSSTSSETTPALLASSQPVKQPTKAAKSKVPVMPDFSSYTSDRLAKEIAKYRFKPVKSRDQMIVLLQRCWEGKHRTALNNLSTNGSSRKTQTEPIAKVSKNSEDSPERPRGRPRKDSTATTPTKMKSPRKKALDTVEYLEMDSDTPLSQIRTPKKSPQKPKLPAEDIFDSDTTIAPSPPRRSGSQAKAKPLPLIPNSAEDDDLDLSSSTLQTVLFKHISSAVTGAMPAKDAKNPSWHEKILLYDPIILEDLTVWLNTGALEKAGWDGEVEPKEVKRWCESNSVCCLWKENLRGGARSRY